MLPIADHFEAYARHHAGRGNRVCHLVGLPCLLIAPVGFAGGAAGMAFLALLAGVYVALEWRLGLLFALACPGVWIVASLLPWQANVMVLAAGLVIPIAGHVLFEKAGPRSLQEGLVGTLIAPLWFLNLFARVIPPRT